MSAASSPATGRVYGVRRVCDLWAFPRAAYYATAPDNRCHRARRVWQTRPEDPAR